jgi:hypothetical protein
MSGTRESEWKAHESLTITYDSDGDAVIVLEDGKWGSREEQGGC